MPRALIIEFGACGVGRDKGPPRVLRLVWLQVAYERRGLTARIARQNRVMSQCRRILWLIARRANRARIAAASMPDPISATIMVLDDSFMSELGHAMSDLGSETSEDIEPDP